MMDANHSFPPPFRTQHETTMSNDSHPNMKCLVFIVILSLIQGAATSTFSPQRYATVPTAPAAARTTNAQQKSEAENLRQRILDLVLDNLSTANASVQNEVSKLFDKLRDKMDENESNVLFDIFDLQPKKDPEAKPIETLKAEVEESDDDEGAVIGFGYLREFMQDVFESYGIPPDRAETCAKVLVTADERGIHSHGLGRLKPIYCDRMDAGILFPNQPIDIVKETDTTALLDGNMGLGLYIAPYAMQMAIDKAKKHGVGFVVVRNSTHYGIAGYYTLMATQNGCVGWAGTNARPSITPTYGVEPMLGTNPLCFALPSDEHFDFCIDCATAITQRGKIEKYAREGVDTPRGCVIDNDGIQRTDTEGILRDLVLGKCALTPMGGAGVELAGYKGYGWATTVELLSIAFQSGPFGKAISGRDPETGAARPMPLGHYFLAIDVEALCPIETFRKNVGTFLRALRNSKKSPKGPGRIWTAGELEHEAFLKQTAHGGMSVPKPLQDAMVQLRDSRPGLKEKYSRLPFE